jgi:hypothetical protein
MYPHGKKEGYPKNIPDTPLYLIYNDAFLSEIFQHFPQTFSRKENPTFHRSNRKFQMPSNFLILESRKMH